MSSTIKVRSDEIIKSRTAIMAKAEMYKGHCENINKYVREMFEAGDFGGAEAREFNAKFQGFQNDFEDMYEKIIEYCQFLEKAADAYSETQEAMALRADRLSANR